MRKVGEKPAAKKSELIIGIPSGAIYSRSEQGGFGYWSSSQSLKMTRGEVYSLLQIVLRALIEGEE